MKTVDILGRIVLLLVYMPIILLILPVVLHLMNSITEKDTLFFIKFLLILSLFGSISWYLKNTLENATNWPSIETIKILLMLAFYSILLNLFPFYIFHHLVGINIFCWQFNMPPPILVSPQKEFLAWATILFIPVIQVFIYYKEKNIEEAPNWLFSSLVTLFFCFFFIGVSIMVGGIFPNFFRKFEINHIYVSYKFFSLFTASICFLSNILVQILVAKAEKT